MDQYITTSIEAYYHGLRIANLYGSIYLRALETTLKEDREAAIEASVGGGAIGALAPTWAESLYNRWLRNVDEQLGIELRSDHFASLLSKYVQLLLQQRSFFRKAGYPVDYMDRLFDWYVRSQLVFSLVPKESHLAPFDVVYRKGKARLLHYRHSDEVTPSARKQPLMIIYAPINTFQILDLNPERSVVRNLLASDGLDIYLLDWGYPDQTDNSLSLEDYLRYVDDAAKVIKDQTKEDKISILGYCWGGLFALVHTALNPEDIRNLVLMAVPVDFSKDNTILARWSKSIDTDRLVEEFGHMDGQVLDLGFLMRNPPRYGFDKYLKLFQRSSDSEFVDTFVDVERWLYDTPPIPGVLYREIINHFYRNNMLISGQMQVMEGGEYQKVDLKRITVPVLSVIAENDDLVSPESSTAIGDHISSKDKSVMQNPGGHVALCISSNAHRNLWPQVAKWLLSR